MLLDLMTFGSVALVPLPLAWRRTAEAFFLDTAMTLSAQPVRRSRRPAHPETTRGSRWLRRVFVGSVTLVAVLAAGTYAGLHFMVAAAPAPLALPALSGSQAPGIGASADGVWTVRGGSVAGFRAQISLLGQGGTIAGRSTALSGTLVMTNGELSSASFTIDLTRVEISGKPNAGFNQMLDAATYPVATFALVGPIHLTAHPLQNTTYRATAIGSLTMHGVTRQVTVTFAARYTGSALQAAGSLSVAFSEWGLKAPFGIQDGGTIEFLLQMSR